MGNAGYYKPGDNNAVCDRCGRTFKASELLKTWDGLYVCRADWEPRHPQDYVKGVLDGQSVKVSRPEGPDTFVQAAQDLPLPPNPLGV